MSGKDEVKAEKAKSKYGLRRKRKADRMKQKIKISVPVPEGLKKSWEREKRATLRHERKKETELKELPEKRAKQAQRIEGFEEEYRKLKEAQQQEIFKARLDGNFYKPADPKVMILVRIRGINRISPKVKKSIAIIPFVANT